MKKKLNSRVISFFMSVILLLGMIPTSVFAASFVDFLTLTNFAEFATLDNEQDFERVQLFGNGKATHIPVLYRTDTLDLKFDGWYTERMVGVSKLMKIRYLILTLFFMTIGWKMILKKLKR